MARLHVDRRTGAVLVLVLVAGTASSGRAADESLVGTRVIARARETTLKVGDTVVSQGEVHRVYRVERANGPWLWVVSESLRGWVQAADVIPFGAGSRSLHRRDSRPPPEWLGLSDAWAHPLRPP